MSEHANADDTVRVSAIHRTAEVERGEFVVSLWYPQRDGAETATVTVDLMDVRAARDIKIRYDFDRDGYVISAQSGEPNEMTSETPYTEVAFVAAWDR